MILAKEWFRDWFNSAYYHELYGDHDDDEAAALINLLLGILHPAPGSRLLDVACGRGRHARMLAQRGFDVTGIDLAPASIAYAKQFESENLHFFEHDMRLPCWINYFDIAFNFFTSFGYFSTRREHDDSLRTISQALRPGGVFVLDYLNIAYAVDHLVADARKNAGRLTYHLTKWSDDKHIYKKIQVNDGSALPGPTYTERIEKFGLTDFQQMFAKQGLDIIQVFGDYQLNPYVEKLSPRLLVIARKQAGPPR